MCMMDNGEVVFLSGSSEDIMMYVIGLFDSD